MKSAMPFLKAATASRQCTTVEIGTCNGCCSLVTICNTSYVKCGMLPPCKRYNFMSDTRQNLVWTDHFVSNET